MALLKRYTFRFADLTAALTHMADKPDQYPVGSLATAADTNKVYVSFEGNWVLVGGQS